ncbi:hypothetical protein ACSW8Q_16175 (plasmid) [Clostridium perfringens]|uniref:Uncharacterized protein n=1 Tax=Clostridium perfringens E str. JGS1987 TaxID=451755 RepID=B1BU26_CLOPF|nr:hypothetical protein [Clostridium perfringens]EDT14804.1 conserved hypothetical protein [Clostridium perfringens E str. JGS1987]ELC8332993.1 hypothetical protein [Clostridium perfringens]ELC8464182.1 hypothetical protein [Clostridium perfringens]MDK0553983.1 hypothetical protein [Clostridium perfringens]
MYTDIKNNESSRFSKKKKITLITLLLLILLLIGGFLTLKWYDNYKIQTQEGQLTGTVGTIPGLSNEELQKELQKQADESLFSFNINSKPVFENGKSEGNLRIANPQYNVYPIEVIIRLKDTNEVIFKSGKIQPNHYIEKAKLTKNLKKGDYEAVATIQAFDPKDNDKYLGKAQAILNISVLN